MGLSISASPSDKPEARRLHFEKINARRRKNIS
jgi:hypothetical protein